MSFHYYDSPPYHKGQIATGAIWSEHIESGEVERWHYDLFSIDENKIDTGQVWTARCNAAWGYRDTIAEAIKEFPPGTEIVHDLGYVPEFVSLTKLSGGVESGNLFLTGRTMSSIFIFAEAGTSGIFVHWWCMR